MGQVVLLGDSIFDNARYVPNRPAVIDQLRVGLGAGWQATLLAIDGSVNEDVADQLRTMPTDATHLIISSGGNDALSESSILSERCHNVAEALERIHEARERFRISYHAMLEAVLSLAKPTVVCTVYDRVPGLGRGELTALSSFNELILREAIAHSVPVIDLRLICGSPGDYSPLSPIEPSVAGGSKITRAIAEVVKNHDFGTARTMIYT